jgi:N-acetylneuraminic acid mutarotase
MKTLLLSLMAITLIPSTAVHAGNLMAFMHETQDGQKQIVLADERGRNPQAVTRGSAWHLYPTLSPDGSRLAYVTGSGPSDLRVVLRDRVTGQDRTITGSPGFYLHPSFSGDGKLLVFSGPGANNQQTIYLQSLTQPHAQPLALTLPHAAYFPSLSSDGRWLVYQSAPAPDQRELVLFDRLNNQSETLRIPGQKKMAPHFSFDDRHLVYTSLRQGNWDVYRMRLKDRVEERLTFDPADDFAPTLDSEDRVVFASNREGHFALYRVDTGRTPQKLYQARGDVYAPSVSGDLSIQLTQQINLPAPARSSFGAVLVEDKIYVVGGHQGREHTYPPESFSDQADVLDLKTGTWTRLPPRPVKAHGFDLATCNGKVYAFGGFAYSAQYQPKWTSLDRIDRYDPLTNQWSLVGHMPRRRSSNVVLELAGKVYLFGGWDSTPKFQNDFDGTFHDEVDVFDCASETMTELAGARLPLKRRAFSGLVHDGKALLLGGIGQGARIFDLLDLVTEFDPLTQTWKERAKLPFPSFAPGAGVLDGSLFLFGGMRRVSARDYEYVNHVVRLRGGSDRWHHTGRSLRETKGFPIVVQNSQAIYVLGGHSYEGGTDEPVRTIEKLELR